MKKLLIILLLASLGVNAQKKKHNIIYSDDHYLFQMGVSNYCKCFHGNFTPNFFSNLVLDERHAGTSHEWYVNAQDVIYCADNTKYFHVRTDSNDAKWYFTGHIDSIRLNGKIIIPNKNYDFK